MGERLPWLFMHLQLKMSIPGGISGITLDNEEIQDVCQLCTQETEANTVS